MTQIRIPDVPAEIMEAVNGRAEAGKMTLADVFVEAICARYRLRNRWETGRYQGGSQTSDLTLKVPDEIRAILRREGPAKGRTIRGVALNSVAMMFALEPVDETRRPK